MRTRSTPTCLRPFGPENSALVLRIERADRPGSVVLVLSGRLELQHLDQLRAQFAAQSLQIIVDFTDVRLVDRDVIETLAKWELEGIKFENCPVYVRDWIAKVQNRK
jgi:hypothetical protein